MRCPKIRMQNLSPINKYRYTNQSIRLVNLRLQNSQLLTIYISIITWMNWQLQSIQTRVLKSGQNPKIFKIIKAKLDLDVGPVRFRV